MLRRAAAVVTERPLQRCTFCCFERIDACVHTTGVFWINVAKRYCASARTLTARYKSGCLGMNVVYAMAGFDFIKTIVRCYGLSGTEC